MLHSRLPGPAQGDYIFLHPAVGISQCLGLMEFSIGDKVCLTVPLSFLKTTDPMPMLRPPDLVSPEEVGKSLDDRINH